MQSDDLTAEQHAKMRDALSERMKYFRMLKERMEQEHFHPRDPLFVRVDKLLEAAHDLWVHLHYRSCGMTGGNIVNYPGDRTPP